MGEKEFAAKGVSYCATCDGMFFKDKDVAVVGGGDTAIEDALFLSNICKKVHIIHRRQGFRASDVVLSKTKNTKNIEFHLDKTVAIIEGNNVVNNLKIEDTIHHNKSNLPVSALFVAIGSHPKTSIFKGQVDMDNEGYINVLSPSTKTSMDGVFAAGDCADPKYKQAIIAAGHGAVAGIDASEYLFK